MHIFNYFVAYISLSYSTEPYLSMVILRGLPTRIFWGLVKYQWKWSLIQVSRLIQIIFFPGSNSLLVFEENDQNKDVDIKAKILVLRSGKLCCIYLNNQSWANRHLQWHTRIVQKICSKLTIKAPELHQWSCSDVFIVNFEQISHIVFVFPLLSLNK